MGNKEQPRLPQGQQIELLMQSISTHSGPLPPAEEFALYEKTVPGTGSKILEVMEKETDRRWEYNNKALDDKIKSGRIGQYCAFI
jgi:uncharacterized membrane protein